MDQQTPPSDETVVASQSRVVARYDVELAQSTETREKGMTFKAAVREDKKMIFWVFTFSCTIVMEGYGLALITFLFSFDDFKRRFGSYDSGANQYVLPYTCTTMLPLMAQIGSLIGIALASPMQRHIGYRWTMCVCLLLSCIFWVLPYVAQNVSTFMAGFFLLGMPWGVFQVLSPAYASEISSLRLRPILTTWNNLCWVLGQLMASVIALVFSSSDSGTSYKTPFTILAGFAFVLLIIIFFAPESPYWLLMSDKTDRARTAVKRLLRGDSNQIEGKLAMMMHTIAQESQRHDEEVRVRDLNNNNKNNKSVKTRMARHLQLLQGTDYRRTEIACVTWVIQQLCGSNLIAWAVKLLEGAGLSTSESFLVNLAIPGAGIIGTLLSWLLMQRAGRRTIYFWGLLIMCVLLTLCGAVSFISNTVIAGYHAGAALAAYTLVYDLTVGPVCFAIVSEIPSLQQRAATISLARGAYLIFGFVNHVVTPKMLGPTDWNWGAKSGFLYAGMCCAGMLYTWFRIPETKGINPRELDILFAERVPVREFSADRAFRATEHAAGEAEELRSRQEV